MTAWQRLSECCTDSSTFHTCIAVTGAAAGAYLVLQHLTANAATTSATDFSSFLKQPARKPGTGTGSQSRPAARQTDFTAFLKHAPAGQQVRPNSFAAFLRKDPTQQEQDEIEEGAEAAVSAPQPQPHHIPVPVLFGTEYGFCKEIAERLAERLRAAELYWPIMTDMADAPEGFDLCRYQTLLVICSTQGDGVPPSEARAFCDWLSTPAAPSLAHACPAAEDQEHNPVAFSVLAAGDKSYINFCACGKMVDARLEALGGHRLHARTDLNKEDWKSADAWIEGVLAGLRQLGLCTFERLGGTEHLQADQDESSKPHRWGKARPYWGRITAIDSLCTISCPDDRDTVRVELDLGDSGLSYAPGDALGVYPHNSAEAVQALLEVLSLQGTEPVDTPSWHYHDARSEAEESLTLRDALAKCYDLRSPRPSLLDLLLTLAPAAALTHEKLHNGHLPALMENGNSHKNGHLSQNGKTSAAEATIRQRIKVLLQDEAAVEAYFTPRHVLDILQDFLPSKKHSKNLPADFLGRFLGCLRPLLPRLYSISSSMLEGPTQVQITVAAVRYDSLGRSRVGVASNFLASGCKVGDELAVYMHANPDFRLPADDSLPLIMVGPGTGLAPFRAFIMERLLRRQNSADSSSPMAGNQACAPHADTSLSTAQPDDGSAAAQGTGSAQHASGQSDGSSLVDGRDLLFFGSRRRDQDYLYGEQLERWHREGVIALHTAFSREQGHKVYVQQRLREAGARVWEVLQQGACFYVCGDAAYMAGDVEQALLDIIAAEGAQDAPGFLEELQSAKRYQRDVWF